MNNIEKSVLGFLICLAFIDLKFSFVYPMESKENILSRRNPGHTIFVFSFPFLGGCGEGKEVGKVGSY